MNLELLEKAARKFVAEWPDEKFDMSAFIVDVDDEGFRESGDAFIHEVKAPFCKTAACFAGAMPWLGMPEEFWGYLDEYKVSYKQYADLPATNKGKEL